MEEKEELLNRTNNFTCPNLQSALFGLYTGVLLLFSFASIIFTMLLLNLICAHGLYHANVRLTLQHFCVTNLLTSVLLFVHGINNFGVLTFGYDVLRFPSVLCLMLNDFRNAINTVAIVLMSVIGIERLIATLRQRFLDPENPSWTMKLIIVLVWVGGITNGSITVYKHGNDKTIKICYCYMSSSSKTTSIIIGFMPYFIIEAVTIACFVLVSYINKRLSDSIMNVNKHTLQARYITWNNIDTTKSLLPTVVTNSLLYFGLIMMQFVLKVTYANNEMITAIISWSLTFVLVSLGSFVIPLLLAKFNEKLELAIKRKCKKLFRVFNRCSKSNNQVEPFNRHVVSFKIQPDQSQVILNQIWEKRIRPASRTNKAIDLNSIIFNG